MEIFGAIKTYDWGSVGQNSKVAQLALKVDETFAKEFDANTPYAELWLGDHVSGPSTIKVTGEPLDKWLSKLPLAIGGMEKIPFLFKVLSITKPLSIQVHPNKAQAEHLHATRPDIYKDPNHKPEISIALTDFSALCGFRTPLELHRLLTSKYEMENGRETTELLSSIELIFQFSSLDRISTANGFDWRRQRRSIATKSIR